MYKSSSERRSCSQTKLYHSSEGFKNKAVKEEHARHSCCSGDGCTYRTGGATCTKKLCAWVNAQVQEAWGNIHKEDMLKDARISLSTASLNNEAKVVING